MAGNTDDGTAPDVVAVGDVMNDLTVQHSLIGDITGSGITVSTGTGNILNQLPLLTPLADNGGLTQTHALLLGSPAIDAGDDTLAVNGFAPLTADQRGGVFVRSFDDPTAPGTGVDIGAFELHALLVDNPIDEDDGNVAVGDLSLREAVRLANDSSILNTITFDGTVFTGGDSSVIRLTQGELVISASVRIDGTLATDVVITGDANDDDVTLAGTSITDVLASFGGTDGAADDLLDDNSRVLNFSNSTGNLTIAELTVTGGRTTGQSEDGGGILFLSDGALNLISSSVSGSSTSGDNADGGGIHSGAGDVSLTNSTVSRNRTTGFGSLGGGISSNFGDVSLTNSTVSENSSTAGRGNGGGISSNLGAVTLTNSTVSGNSSSNGSGGGIYARRGDVSLTDSTVSENYSNRGGGGIRTFSGDVSLTNSTVSGNSGTNGNGGGIYTTSSNVSLTNSTVSGNSSDGDGAGLWTFDSTVLLVNSTVTGNSASGVGGGLSLRATNAINERLTLHNSIVAGNTDNGTAPDVEAVDDVTNDLIVEHSLIGDTTGSGITATTGPGNILNQSASLGPLADNGGPTLTHALLPDSPAIDIGNNALAVDENGNSSDTDQRGEIRVVGAVDIGAFETQFDGVRSLVVTTAQDVVDPSDGLTSLREAIAFTDAIFSSNGDSDTITFDASVFTGGDNNLIRLTNGELSISDSLIIDGSSVGGVVITGDANGDDVTVDGTDITDVSASFGESAGDVDDLLDDNSRVINFSSDEGNLTLTGLTLTGGRTSENNVGAETTHSGGGIRFDSSGSLTLSVTVSGNSTNGGSANGGGIFTSEGDVILTDSTVSGNSTTLMFSVSSGGGIFSSSGNISLINSIVNGNRAVGNGGGIFATFGNVSLTNNSTVSGNSSSYDGGGILTRAGDVTLHNSSVSGNVSGYDNAGFRSSDGGGIRTSDGNVSLTNSTVSGNSSLDDGGGVFTFNGNVSLINSTLSGNSSGDGGGGIWGRASTVVIVNSTIAGNSSPIGGGIRLASSSSSLTLRNSIVAGNSDNGTAPDVDATGVALNDLIIENSLIGDTTGSGITATTGVGNILDQPALLAPLADNGGPTLTHALLSGSPAIDAGDDAMAVDVDGNALLRDQRGGASTRVFDDPTATGTGVDIGAFELHALVVDNQVDEDDGNHGVGDLSLREAIGLVIGDQGLDTITFDGVVFTGGDNNLIRLTQGELVISDTLGIDATSVGGVVLTGDANDDDVTMPGTHITDVSASSGERYGAPDDLLSDNSRLLNFTGSGGLNLAGLTLTGGRSLDFFSGGAIITDSGNLSLASSTVSGNTGRFFGGAIFTGSGDVSLTSSTISDNSSGRRGGGIFTFSGNVSLTSSTVSDNSTTGDSTLAEGGGIFASTGDVSLISSTVSGNSTVAPSGYGGGISTYSGNISLTSSTVSGNRASDFRAGGGGISTRFGNVSLTNSTVTDNFSNGFGGGITISSQHTLTLHNSIVAGNISENGPDVGLRGDVTDQLIVQNSLIGDTARSGITATTGAGNILNQPAMLGPLADNGGPTLTHALLPDSPAIGAGSNALAAGLLTDQRDENRIENGTVDIGAFERQDVQIAGQHIFYNNSSFDSASNSEAIATDKVALRNGETATFRNYTSYIHGINGIAVDLFNSNNLVASDFQFKFGNGDDVDNYATLDSSSIITSLTTVVGEGVDGSDRVFIEFADGTITNGWLQVTVIANSATGLTNDEAFYFGNAIGESGNDSTNAIVNLADIGNARTNQTGFGSTDVLNAFDFNRDARVNLADLAIARTNQSGFSPISLITPSSSNGGSSRKLLPVAQGTASSSILPSPAAPVSLAAVADVPAVTEIPLAIKQHVQPASPNRTDNASSLAAQAYVAETFDNAFETELVELNQPNNILGTASLELADSVAAQLTDNSILDSEFAITTSISPDDAQVLDDVFANVFDAD